MGKKPVSIKFPNDMLSDIDEECNGLGCNRTDFVIDAVQEKLQGKIEEYQPKEKPKPNNRIILDDEPKPTIGTIKTTNDGKYRLKNIQDDGVQLWEEVEENNEVQNARIVLEPEPKQIDNSNKPPIEMVLFNGKYIPKAEVYEI